MKKLLLSLALACSLFAAAEPQAVVVDESKHKIEEFDVRLKQLNEINNMQEQINNSQIDTNEVKRKVDDGQNNTIKMLAQQIDRQKYRIESLESTIDKQQSTINKLNSILYTLERKVK